MLGIGPILWAQIAPRLSSFGIEPKSRAAVVAGPLYMRLDLSGCYYRAIDAVTRGERQRGCGACPNGYGHNRHIRRDFPMIIALLLVSFCALCWATASALLRFHTRETLPRPIRDDRREAYRAHAWSTRECI